ncbi:microspherule protein 1 isoform X2 [Onthophagus taurus]|uniref:microspherule protein 1 isoform X2 n=1 Tax=Onthophagus taurus TaxID=166361 RepID=UPI000C206FE0|nr:microspherule protein 1 isoform X2 [Onthophagus taurus]
MNSTLDSSDYLQPDKQEVYSPQMPSYHDISDVTKRRSSNRSIKRKKFDDELVEYSLGLPSQVAAVKTPRSRTQPSHTAETPLPAPTTPQVPVPSTSTQVEIKRRPPSKSFSSKRNRKGRQQNQVATKDLGRWKPTDDLALIIGIQQTNDLKMVHLGTKFSCRFTVQELQQRWYALLYDHAVSRVAVAAMRNLHPDMVAAIQERALWSTQEEQLLGSIKSVSSDKFANPDISVFVNLLAEHPDVFHSARTPIALQRHWGSMRLYHLLPDQNLIALPSATKPCLAFSDAEDMIQDQELSEPPDEALDREMRLQQRRSIKEIRQLENEIGRWNVLVDSVTGVCPGEMDGKTLAVLRGRMVRYLMRSREITIGRSAKGHNVDIDLFLEGAAHKVSRRQGTLRLRNTGEFYLSSEGRRPIFVDGRPITTGNKVRLYDNSVIEIATLRFIFCINQDLIRVIHNESVRLNIPP